MTKNMKLKRDISTFALMNWVIWFDFR